MQRVYSDVCQQKGSVEAVRQLHLALKVLTCHGYSVEMADDDISRLTDIKLSQFLKPVRISPTFV